MKPTAKVIAGDLDYQKGGYYIADYQDKEITEEIVTFRCDNCFQHLSLYEYSIDKNGLVSPDVVCINCKHTHKSVSLTGFSKLSKKKGEVFIR